LLIDEWQRAPEIWDSVRRLVDDGIRPGRFLLTGSATPRSGTDTHSGAGRIQALRMRPMALHERGVAQSTVSLSALLEGTAEKLAGETDFTSASYFEAIVGERIS
jgi:predicted AAA+ superfamily ATPase